MTTPISDQATASCVLFERRGAVALITLNRPAALNSFDEALRRQFTAALQRAAVDTAVRAVVLAASGRAFCAGADLKAMMAATENSGTSVAEEVRHQLAEEYGPGIRAIVEMPKTVIAAVDGLVAGIGCAYVLACDLAIMADDAYFTLPFHNIGLVPDGGLSWLLERQIGARRAYELAAECSPVSASRCAELGLVNRVVAKGAACSAALQWAERLALRPQLALSQTKRLLRQAPGLSFAQSLDSEIDSQAICLASADFHEGVAAFLGKREPTFN